MRKQSSEPLGYILDYEVQNMPRGVVPLTSRPFSRLEDNPTASNQRGVLQLDIIYMATLRLALRLHGNKKSCPTGLFMVMVKVVHMVLAMVKKVRKRSEGC